MGYFEMLLQVLKDVVPVITCGVSSVSLFSCILFCIQLHFELTPGCLGVGASLFQHGHIHRLLLYPFYHRTSTQLLLNIAALLFLGGSLERGVGTVRFLSVFLVLSTTTGLCYSFLDLMLQEDSSQTQTHTEGLLPIALACVALTTVHTKMTKGFLCGVSFPTMALPWVLLIITTALTPHSVLPCNVIAILMGWACGKGCFSFLDMSETRAGLLEKTMPLRWLKSVCSVMFIPASTEERRRTLLPQICPTPGSYPVQAYAPLSSINSPANQMHEGWANTNSGLSGPAPPSHHQGHGMTLNFNPNFEMSYSHNCSHGQSHGHSHGHSHDHGHGHSHSHSHSHG